MATKAETPLVQPPVRIPSQQHLVEYMHKQPQLSQSLPSPVTHYQPAQASSTNSLPCTLLLDPSDSVLPPSSLYQQQDLVPTPAVLLSSRQVLEHENAGAVRHNGHTEQRQQSSLPTPYQGSSQSVLKLMTTKKVAEKKQGLSCFFCRKRKIACGRPDPESEDQTCK
jgi:hemin uptake protein HemP